MGKKIIKEVKSIVSVITVVFNSPDLLEKTIKSVLRQTYNDIEYIIIDGASSDKKTIEVIKKYENNISFWITEPDNGIYDAMNKGISYASSGSYLNFLNAGDVYYNENTLQDLFSNKSILKPIIYGDIIVVSENNLEKYKKSEEFTKDSLLKRGTGVICHQALFIKKEYAPFYNSKYKLKGELDWYFSIVDKYPDIEFSHVKIPVVYYYLGGSGHKYFLKNRMEWISCIVRRYGIKTLFKYKIIQFLYKNSFYRYPFLKNFHTTIIFPFIKIKELLCFFQKNINCILKH